MDEQLKPTVVTPEKMKLWEEMAIRHFPHLLPGDINWPMIVRSLIAEIRAQQN